MKEIPLFDFPAAPAFLMLPGITQYSLQWESIYPHGKYLQPHPTEYIVLWVGFTIKHEFLSAERERNRIRLLFTSLFSI